MHEFNVISADISSVYKHWISSKLCADISYQFFAILSHQFYVRVRGMDGKMGSEIRERSPRLYMQHNLTC